MALGEQPDYGYMDAYSKKKYGSTPQQDQYADQFADLKNQAAMTTQPAQEASSTTDKTSNSSMISPEAAQGFQRGQSGGLGSGVMGAGVATGNPYLIAGGLALSAVEGNAQAKQKEEEAKAVEAQQRKQAQLSAINSLISVSKGLSV